MQIGDARLSTLLRPRQRRGGSLGVRSTTARLVAALAITTFGLVVRQPRAVDADSQSDAYAAVVAADAPAAYWRLDDPSGSTAVADSAGTNVGAVSGTVTQQTAGVLTGDAATSFDGVSGSVDVPAAASLEPSSGVSVEAWIETTSTADQAAFDDGALRLHVDAGTVSASVGASDGPAPYELAGNGVADGLWHHVVVTQDATGVTLYVDGSAVAAAAWTSSQLAGYAETTALGHCAGDCADDQFFSGTLDEVAVYDTALSAERVTAHFDAATSAPPPPPPSPIKHIVIIDQENHSFDNVLGVWCVETGRCDGSVVGLYPDGTTHPLTASPDVVPGVAHQPVSQVIAVDNGRMDGFPLIGGCHNDPHPCMTQYTSAQIPNTVALASQFALSDRTFEDGNVASWGSHLELAAATLDGFAGSNPLNTNGTGGRRGWGCDSGRSASWWDGTDWTQQYACVPLPDGFDPGSGATTPVPWVPTIMDELDAAGIPWKIYRGQYGWAICPTFADCLYTSQASQMVLAHGFLTDAAAGDLPAVSFVSPSGADSQHNRHMAQGDNWIGAVVSAIENGPDWDSTAIFLTWDDCAPSIPES